MHPPRSPLRSPLRRGTTAWAAAAATAAALLAAPAATAAPASAPSPHATVDPGVTAAVDAGGEATFFVVLADHADLSRARAQRGHEKKARAAFDELRAEASRSQASLTRFL